MYLYKEIDVEKYFSNKDEYLLIDVRSQAEFAEDHLYGAVNIPILDNEERVIIGTIYKEKGVKSAKSLAREITLPKMLGKLNKIHRNFLKYLIKSIILLIMLNKYT